MTGEANSVPENGAEFVVRSARQAFVAGRRVDMGELIAAAGVDRTTVFRWVGSRDKLLARVIWSVTEPTIDIAAARAEGTGGARIAAAMGHFAAMANQGFFNEFIRREPERALRIMTTRAGGVQHHIVAKVEAMLADEVAAGNLVPPLPIHDMAFLLVRIGESFVYTTVISGEEPDAVKVHQASAALLGAPIPGASTEVHHSEQVEGGRS
ncbi:QsdR family transcriptional regulator [Nocardia lasii]|uniref:QsdR family transcriptional regulator n=1 Tax=Nocardia lasii TaxID=1616107 RepID=A0ABW1JPZ5_9NOCA